MAVRLFIGNLPYRASEADLRAHFAAVAEPSHVVMPVDRETGRPRGFAFVEFADRDKAEEVISKFDAQPFQGRTSRSAKHARARIVRRRVQVGGFAPAAGRRRLRRSATRRRRFGGGGPAASAVAAASAARVPVAAAVRPARPGGPPGPGGRDRSANFGPPAPPKRLRSKKGAAAGTQAARPDQGAQRRPHLRRRRSRGRRADRHRRRRDQRDGRQDEAGDDGRRRRRRWPRRARRRVAQDDGPRGRHVAHVRTRHPPVVEPLDHLVDAQPAEQQRPSLAGEPNRRRQPRVRRRPARARASPSRPF